MIKKNNNITILKIKKKLLKPTGSRCRRVGLPRRKPRPDYVTVAKKKKLRLSG